MSDLSGMDSTVSQKGRPAAFIDRDGVINRDHGYVSDWDAFEFLPGVVEGLRTLQSLGFQLIVVTNQSGIGRGYYDEEAFQSLSAQMSAWFAERGVEITGVYFCPHHPVDAVAGYRGACQCRKPEPGMLLRAASEHALALNRSIMIGDKPSDIEAGKRAGVARCYQVTDGAAHADATPVDSLLNAASIEQALAH
ncbi:MAG: D-glycero-beta-D-manno-heptose 1,7-bisphosphate 7-phosphatase [Halieaceae bacterium]|nr:D-glycero-beta-D-manno-heptose 1,7-bisphosphate 7-phosphatase [Halieaceae bacterium]